MRRLEGTVAIVTGAARGQGAAEARLLAAEGARVVVADVLDADGAVVAAELANGGRFVHLDVSSTDQWRNAVDVAASMGPVRTLVNNAAVHWSRTVEEENLADFNRMLAVNVAGPFVGIQSVTKLMADAGGGSIVNVSSVAGLVGFGQTAAYTTSKWALRGLTRAAALTLADRGIRVNSIHPGPIDTAMLPDGGGRDRFDHVPLRRCGTPEEVADLVLFLASADSSYITGAELAIDGGMTAGGRTR